MDLFIDLSMEKEINYNYFDQSVWDSSQILDAKNKELKQTNAEKEDVLIAGNTKGIPNSIQSYTPPNSNFNNPCAQAACTAIIEAWGKNPYPGDMDRLFTEIHSNHGPDIIGGALGTSPNRIMDILNAYGLRFIDKYVEPWLLGGFINPANQVLFQSHWATLWNMANNGFPAIVLCQTGYVGGSPLNLHWLVFRGSHNFNTELSNTLFSYGYSDKDIPDSIFHQGWECPTFPIYGLRFRAIIPFI